MHAQFIALVYKIPHISSFAFVQKIKSALRNKGIIIDKIGFSGTLDPFARGQLLLATNRYTRLLPHIEKSYKSYQATLFLGCNSASLDTENIINIEHIAKQDSKLIESIFNNLIGDVRYTPPRFSAKHINGSRAYELARENKKFSLPECLMNIRQCELISYNHPFVSFRVTLSEGGFVRSIAEIVGKSLNCQASLCYLERLSEGQLAYYECLNSNNTISLDFEYFGVCQNLKLVLLDIKNVIKYDTISLVDYEKQAFEGKKIHLNNAYNITKNGIYLADFGSYYGIIDINRQREVKYIVNRIDKC
ncbi:tRNA pseudouridine(55) synthase TruB [Helicobacter muridarum]|uniref:tRNA pseudouridine(55) synthase n=1 Tax=Helicobacter muridarum TaxID=216 RepID=A0A099TYR8_9HELI|nr:tRNA pseudouridine(55) synthase TruB [Helicobacter muridarum]TLE01658.1 tRNA pseudouridine(55) synthase TruB [Helicobacter muridarum]STQ86282.1 tRNA pseudouridine synthase B [Helicobacter muridarum]